MTDDTDQGNGPDEATIKEAREMGWTPKEQFKGDPEKWVDADEFVERGQHLMPILRKTNERLKRELKDRDTRIDTLTTEVQNVRGTLDRLDAHYSAANKRAAEQAIASLKNQIKEAREEGDVDKEVEVLRQIGLAQDEVRKLEDEAEKRKKEKENPDPNKGKTKDTPRDGLDPKLQEWQDENPWFGTDAKKTKQFNRIAEDLREEVGDELVGVPFLKKCEALWEEQFGDNPPPDKTDTGNRSGGGQGGDGKVKGWNQLPKEAKDICMADVPMLVGPDKKFKTVGEWQAEYVRIYNAY